MYPSLQYHDMFVSPSWSLSTTQIRLLPLLNLLNKTSNNNGWQKQDIYVMAHQLMHMCKHQTRLATDFSMKTEQNRPKMKMLYPVFLVGRYISLIVYI